MVYFSVNDCLLLSFQVMSVERSPENLSLQVMSVDLRSAELVLDNNMLSNFT